MFRQNHDRVEYSTFDAWLLALLQSLAVLNLNVWMRLILS